MIRRVTILSIVLAACGSDSPTPAELIMLPEEASAVTGIIVARDVPISISYGRPTIHVKSDPTEECGTVFVITTGTIIGQRIDDGEPRRARIEDLKEGRTVKVWATYELRSCPAQSTADAVELLRR